MCKAGTTNETQTSPNRYADHQVRYRNSPLLSGLFFKGQQRHRFLLPFGSALVHSGVCGKIETKRHPAPDRNEHGRGLRTNLSFVPERNLPRHSDKRNGGRVHDIVFDYFDFIFHGAD
jgi:hypothetical protein